ncbi:MULTISPECIES: ATP-binding protein [Sandaracinus]|uniref:ATP-binding protein n=1 Tax=Sandaracinus TaxID=1055688 RepID=UPI002E34B52A|nr:ATP-binding protein [Sandaracinus amylolyticus]
MGALAPPASVQALSMRYERKSIVLTTNLAFVDWPSIFPSATSGTALIDRVIHHADVSPLWNAEMLIGEQLKLAPQRVNRIGERRREHRRYPGRTRKRSPVRAAVPFDEPSGETGRRVDSSPVEHGRAERIEQPREIGHHLRQGPGRRVGQSKRAFGKTTSARQHAHLAQAGLAHKQHVIAIAARLYELLDQRPGTRASRSATATSSRKGLRTTRRSRCRPTTSWSCCVARDGSSRQPPSVRGAVLRSGGGSVMARLVVPGSWVRSRSSRWR